MIHSASFYTFEIDQADVALEEIRAQMEQKLPLCRHTAGVLQCDPEFIASGVASHICKSLGFPIIGGTSPTMAVNDAIGDLMLSLLVLTSDDVDFVSAHTRGLDSDLFGAVERSLDAATAGEARMPGLVLAIPPIIEEHAGDWYVTAFERRFGAVPVFGSLAVDDSVSNYNCGATLCDGDTFHLEMSYLLLYGPVNPRFLLATVPSRPMLPASAEITRAEGNLVHEIGGMKAITYFEHIGLAKDGVLRDGVDFVPFMLSPKGGDSAHSRPFVRALIRFTEDGSAVCRGDMYENMIFTIGSCLGFDVIDATAETIGRLNAMPDVGAALIFSCIVRRTTCGVNSHVEAKCVHETLRPDIPFMLAYSGGEICPMPLNGDGTGNRFHNYSLIVCVF